MKKKIVTLVSLVLLISAVFIYLSLNTTLFWKTYKTETFQIKYPFNWRVDPPQVDYIILFGTGEWGNTYHLILVIADAPPSGESYKENTTINGMPAYFWVTKEDSGESISHIYEIKTSTKTYVFQFDVFHKLTGLKENSKEQETAEKIINTFHLSN
ncbi:hypothetical protein A2954_01365 [Candidatus Roizmanbacteria bacterium RIFCSPLOWO2_01_FULL_37_12]|uniref:Uncharacterized protein n=1 Tax=Candidatus Roizmanbacteria bacterium RIFCSPLOWO2_01_FULL_37_12 TaxID=1802056 RepID=A0A1F7IGI9_9BACT|nr:MAG: hypothetical protein A2954_01365 [Candidatus Roizmanbacteria bacterium RIFCSPLOWO2_01_FULL_37_12]